MSHRDFVLHNIGARREGVETDHYQGYITILSTTELLVLGIAVLVMDDWIGLRELMSQD